MQYFNIENWVLIIKYLNGIEYVLIKFTPYILKYINML